LIGGFLYKRYIYSIFDPLFYNIITSYAGYSIVFFLFFAGYVDNFYLKSFLVTEIAFTFGFFLIKPLNVFNIPKGRGSEIFFKISARVKILCWLSMVLYLMSNLAIFLTVGNPLLNKLAGHLAFQGGKGIFARINSVTLPIILIYIGYGMYFQRKLDFQRKLSIMVVLFFMVLSGSKATFLHFMIVLFYMYLFMLRLGVNLKKKFNKIALTLGIALFTVGVFVTTYFYSYSSVVQGAYMLLMRIVFTGDVYMFSYPYGIIDKIDVEHGNFFSGLFGWTLAGMRLMPWENVPKLVGHAMAEYVYKAPLDFAPNSRHNIFGYVYLGFWGSPVFSFLLGIVSSYMRNLMYYKVRQNIEGMILYILFVLPFFSLVADPVYAIFQYTSLVFIFVPLYFVAYIVSFSVSKSGKNYRGIIVNDY